MKQGSDMSVTLITFSIVLFSFLAIGLSSLLVSQRSVDDYLIGGRQMGPWLSALSAASTNCSGFMFIGLIGLSYVQGIYAFWFFIGIILGSLFAWSYWIPRLQKQSAQRKSLTYLQFLFQSRSHNQASHQLQKVIQWFAGGLTLFFLGLYAAAQLKAGTKALYSLFELPAYIGILMSGVMIWLYCLAGGYRASVWSDAAQSIVMWIAMFLLAWSALSQLGGWEGLLSALDSQDGKLTSLFPYESSYESWFTGFKWTCVGLGCAGQPHIMVRVIALKDEQQLPKTRVIFFAYYLSFVAISILVGICARALLTDPIGVFDAELALPKLASQLLTPALIGVVLAGVFASTISTADSQVLACSAVITQDLKPYDIQHGKNTYFKQKVATTLVIVGVMASALIAPSNVFTLVILSWSVLAAVFIPILTLRVCEQELLAWQVLGLMFVSLLIFFLCKWSIHPLTHNELLWTWLGTGIFWKLSTAYIGNGKNSDQSN
jgi:sodium/proline symporter